MEQERVVDEAIDRLVREVREGLRHGFFDVQVAGEVVAGGKRGLTIKSGKSHRYIIPKFEID